jgi:diphthamide biosynthesis methyltransferase
MLYLVGLGLSDEKDVTVRGLEAIKGSERVYLEAYTSILGVGKDRLVSLYPVRRNAMEAHESFIELYRKLSTVKRSS